MFSSKPLLDVVYLKSSQAELLGSKLFQEFDR